MQRMLKGLEIRKKTFSWKSSGFIEQINNDKNYQVAKSFPYKEDL